MRIPARLRGAALAGMWLLALALPLFAQQDADLRRVWSRLSAEQRDQAAARFATDVAGLDTLHNRLLRRALALDDTDPDEHPWAEPYPFYDPHVHAPDLEIPRRRLDPAGPAASETRERMFARFGARRLRTAWRYDWSARRIVRTADASDPRHVFENGLMGHPPGVDLAEALLEQWLDDGSQHEALAAFGHAYTDREGAVFPLTLYDAWCSAETMEMPDIDNLGIVHELLDDWTTWVSPIPEGRQQALYRRVERLFEEPHRYRALRTALARTYLTGEADLRDGFGPRIDHLHGLWQRHDSAPERLRDALPAPEQARFFMADWGLEVEEDEQLRAAAAGRHLDLHRDAWQVRELLIRIVEEAAAGQDEIRDEDE